MPYFQPKGPDAPQELTAHGRLAGDHGSPTWEPIYFYHNTVISKRKDKTTLLRLSTQNQNADVFNNVVYVEAEGSKLAILDEDGTARLHHNWLKKGYKECHGTLAGTISDSDNITGESPGFRDEAKGDFLLVETSAARNSGMALPKALEAHPVKYELVPPFGFRKRPVDEKPDVGAFELP